MNIPSSIVSQVKKNSGPMDNKYFIYAESALNSLKKIDSDSYCYDYVSVAANVLERIYKGFLQSAVDNVDCYQLPVPNFLNMDHDILGMVLEIKRNFPDVFPYQDRQQWRDIKTFLRELRTEYTDARYNSYPTYEEFVAIRSYVDSQFNLIRNYIKEGNLTKEQNEMELDY